MNFPTIKTDIHLRFSDINASEHVANHVYAQYFEVARMDWLAHVNNTTPDTVLVNLNIDFISELFIQDQVNIVTSCTKRGNKSITLTQQLYANEKLVTKSTSVVVGFNRDTRKSCVIFEGWKVSEVENEQTESS